MRIPHVQLAVDAAGIRGEVLGEMIARLLLTLVIAFGLLAGRALPGADCVQRICECCEGEVVCCSVSEPLSEEPVVPAVQGASVDLKLTLVPLVEFISARIGVDVPSFACAPVKPVLLPSSARIELTCVRLI